jgi:homoserine O-acetyltransferase
MKTMSWCPSLAQEIASVATPANPFFTEAGERLDQAQIAFETWGKLNAERSNAVLVFHALTGDSHAASHPEYPGDRAGWWEPLIGPGAPIDTNHFFAICANTVGSCYGSTGPRSLDPDGRPYNLRFPALTIRDLVAFQLRLLDLLDIQHVACALGGSVGGMEVLELAVMAPERLKRGVVVAASSRFHSQGIAYNEIQRRAIMLDPKWRGGEYPDDDQPDNGVAVARMLGMVTYQSDACMTARFDRNPARHTVWPEFQGRYDVEGYLHYQGDKLADRYDANTYLYLSRAMDSHDIGRGRGGLLSAASQIRASLLFIGISSDILFPPSHVEESAALVRQVGGLSDYWELDSIDGHDAFLKNFDRLDGVLRRGVGTPPLSDRRVPARSL